MRLAALEGGKACLAREFLHLNVRACLLVVKRQLTVDFVTANQRSTAPLAYGCMIPRSRKMMTQSSLYSRVVVSLLALALSGLANIGTAAAQDITGGASVFLASAEVEA